MMQEQELRMHLVKLMRGGQAFRTMDELLEGLTLQEAGTQVDGLPYTIWQLLEHLRFAQHDILDFCQNPDYQDPAWPDDYWTTETTPRDEDALRNTQKVINQDLEAMIRLVQNSKNDLFIPIPHGNGQTLLREAMLVAEHNAYHLAQIVVLRRLLK